MPASAFPALDVAELRRQSEDFAEKLAALKAQIEPADFAWYPYDTLGNFQMLDTLLKGQHRFLGELIGEDPVLDVGCGDGELSLFFESLGCRAHAVDYPRTNYNGMRGVRALKSALGSSVEIREADLDAQFALSGARYGLALLLGVLYHLKNPYYVLETLAAAARYCLLSTVITAVTPDGQTGLGRLPVAYLLDEQEANNDPSNYWVFSEVGLRRLLARTRWEVLDYMVLKPDASSGADWWERQERAFCLMRSLVSEPGAAAELLRGWHGLEEQTWRWTERQFSAALRVPKRSTKATLTLEFVLPESVLERLGPVTLSAKLGGHCLPPETYNRPGKQVYRRPVPADALGADVVVTEFELDRALPADDIDLRERGLIAVSLRLE